MGIWNGTPKFNPDEVAQVQWIKPDALQNDLKLHPENYTYWFRYIMDHYYAKLT